VDGHGIPLSIVVTGANRHDVSQLGAVLGQRIASPAPVGVEENLCADAGYVGKAPEKTMREAGYTPHVRPRGEERKMKKLDAGFRPRRWVVEVCHSWLNRFRKLLVRYEKLHSTYMALLHLAASIIALRKIGIIYG
jgi:transposase